jgi:hypothetical protein
VIVDQTSLPTHVHPFSGTRRPIMESDPCFSNVWMVTPLRNVQRSTMESRLIPKRIVASAPGLGPVLSAAILGNAGDFNRFANLAGVRSFTGLGPKIDQSGLVAGHKGITKAGDAGLRQALYMAADHARHIDPTLVQRYYRLVMAEGKHHNSALCSVSAVLITRIAACWRKGELYELRDEDGEAITEAEGKAACIDRFKIDPQSPGGPSSQHPSQSPQEQSGGSRQKGVGPEGRSDHRPAWKRS